MNDSGTNADRVTIQRQRVERAGCSDACAWLAAPGDITWPARSDVCTFGFAPTIHPLPQCPPAIGVSQLASVEVTLSFREKLPSRKPQENTKSCRDCGTVICFPQCRRCQGAFTALNGIKI